MIIAAMFLAAMIAVAGAWATAPLSLSNNTTQCPECHVNATDVVHATANATKNKTAFSILFIDQNGCEYCAAQAPYITSLVKDGYKVTTINLTTAPNGVSVVKQYGIATTPTTILFKDGKEIHRFTVVTDTASIESYLV